MTRYAVTVTVAGGVEENTMRKIEVCPGSVRTSTTGVEGVDVEFDYRVDNGDWCAGEVTLVPHEVTGAYWSWGALDNWLDGRTVNFVRELDPQTRDALVSEIRRATAKKAEVAS